MPIDWEAVVAPFRQAFLAQTHSIVQTTLLIWRWLEKRLKSVEALERSSRSFPIIDFYNEAVQVSVAAFQHNSLRLPRESGTPRPPGEYLNAGQRFLRGFQRIPESVEESLAIPRYISVVSEALGAIVASLNRWDHPDYRQLFDPGQARSFSDLFGEFFYFVEAISTSVDPLRVVINSQFARLVMAPSSGDQSSGQGPSPVQYIVDALLLIPVAGAWLDAALRWVLISVRVRVLDLLVWIENQIYELRRQALQFAVTWLTDFLHHSYLFVGGVQDQVIELVRNILEFGVNLVADWGDAIRNYLRLISETLLTFTDNVFHDIAAALDGILHLEVEIPYVGITLTVQEILDIATGRNQEAYERLHRILSVSGGLIWGDWGDQAWAAEDILDALASAPRYTIPQVNLPSPASPFPNIYEHFFVTNTVDIQDEIHSLGTTLTSQVPAILDSAGDAMTRIGDAFSASAGRMARIGPLAPVQQIRDRATSIARGMFQEQEDAIRQRMRHDALAAAFDHAVASGGFHIVGAAIPIYVEKMREYWEQNPAPAEPHPTSPHITAQRQRLGRVDVPSVTIRASASELNDGLIGRIAERFRGIVQDAWSTGLQRVEAGT